MLQNRIFPKHLGETFLKYYQQIVDDRLEGKRTGDTLKAAAMKILVNAVFGKLNFPDYWLCDLKALLGVTLNGQLLLLKLIEMLHHEGIKAVYANTDGVSVYVPKDKVETYYRICGKDTDDGHVKGEWEELTGLELETSHFRQMFHRDCNNYLVVTNSGKIKAKGEYDFKRYIEKYGAFNVAGSLKHPIVPYAVQEYFAHDIPFEETITNHTDIYDFCICRKIGNQFTPILLDVYTKEEKKLQQVNRYYISKSPYKLFKRKLIQEDDIEDDYFNVEEFAEFLNDTRDVYRDTDVSVGRNVSIFNDEVIYEDFSQYEVDYDYYLQECYKLINDIEKEVSEQLSLFPDFQEKSLPKTFQPTFQTKKETISYADVTNIILHLRTSAMSLEDLYRLKYVFSLAEEGSCHLHLRFDEETTVKVNSDNVCLTESLFKYLQTFSFVQDLEVMYK